jgi:hypothetical protein
MDIKYYPAPYHVIFFFPMETFKWVYLLNHKNDYTAASFRKRQSGKHNY